MTIFGNLWFYIYDSNNAFSFNLDSYGPQKVNWFKEKVFFLIKVTKYGVCAG